MRTNPRIKRIHQSIHLNPPVLTVGKWKEVQLSVAMVISPQMSNSSQKLIHQEKWRILKILQV